MPATLQRRPKAVTRLGPTANGLRMTARQYDRADFEPGWRYELISGVLVVAPPPLEMNVIRMMNWGIGCDRTGPFTRTVIIST